VIALLVLTGLPLLAEPAAQPPDFLSYVEEVRKAGATEEAQSALLSVAVIMVGDSVLDFPKDPKSGEYGKSYRSTSCPRPGLSKEARSKLAEDAAARREPVLKRLREIADADHSGFVSTREGWEVRLTFEFGAELADLVPKEGTDRSMLCKLLHVTPAEFDQRLQGYSSLVKAFSGMTLRYLPAVPSLPH
jgi:hypothetical protein